MYSFTSPSAPNIRSTRLADAPSSRRPSARPARSSGPGRPREPLTRLALRPARSRCGEIENCESVFMAEPHRIYIPNRHRIISLIIGERCALAEGYCKRASSSRRAGCEETAAPGPGEWYVPARYSCVEAHLRLKAGGIGLEVMALLSRNTQIRRCPAPGRLEHPLAAEPAHRRRLQAYHVIFDPTAQMCVIVIRAIAEPIFPRSSGWLYRCRALRSRLVNEASKSARKPKTRIEANSAVVSKIT